MLPVWNKSVQRAYYPSNLARDFLVFVRSRFWVLTRRFFLLSCVGHRSSSNFGDRSSQYRDDVIRKSTGRRTKTKSTTGKMHLSYVDWTRIISAKYKFHAYVTRSTAFLGCVFQVQEGKQREEAWALLMEILLIQSNLSSSILALPLLCSYWSTGASTSWSSLPAFPWHSWPSEVPMPFTSNLLLEQERRPPWRWWVWYASSISPYCKTLDDDPLFFLRC